MIVLFKAIRQLLSTEMLPYSFYLAFGILLSQFAHIYVYQKNGGTELATWFSQFGITKPLSVITATQLSVIFTITLFLLLQVALPTMLNLPMPKVLSISVGSTVVVCVISNLMFSSIMRVPYEALFCMIPFIAIILKQLIVDSDAPQLTDILKFVIPLCIGLPVVMGGSGFIGSFYQKEHTTVQLQLYRHVVVSAYFLIGTFAFIIYPIVKQILTMKSK